MATEHLPQTITLINDGGTVLDTQNAQAGNIKSFANDLQPAVRAAEELRPGPAAADHRDAEAGRRR